MAVATFAFAASASASPKQAIDFFGNPAGLSAGTLGGQFGDTPAGVAVHDTGAGPANAGDIYVLDYANHRIQRFGRDDGGTPGGTPADTADDTYFFISAWGADVVSEGGNGDQGDATDANFEICTVAAECKAGVASGGNGTTAGNGALGGLTSKAGLAVDPDSGNVYVTDAKTPGSSNNRVNVYDGLGNFLYSFGFDVVESGSGDAGTGYEVCSHADDDVCKAGLPGSGVGQIGTLGTGPGVPPVGAGGITVSIADADPETGSVFLADSANSRVNTYNLDGSDPASIGSSSDFDRGNPEYVAVDSRGILYAPDVKGAGLGGAPRDRSVTRYDTENANGTGVGFLDPLFAAPFDEYQRLTRSATAGQYRLSFGVDTTANLDFDATAPQVETALEALPSIGVGNVSVGNCGGGCDWYNIRFIDALSNTNVAKLVVSNGTTPLTGTIDVTAEIDGHDGPFDQISVNGLAVDPDTDALFVLRSSEIWQLGPANAPGLTAPPTAEDERHGTSAFPGGTTSLAVEPATGRIYVSGSGLASEAGRGVYILDESSPTPPTALLDSCGNVTATSADCQATINPNGPPATRYRFEYVDDAEYQANGFDNATAAPEVLLGVQVDPQVVEETISTPPLGLAPNTTYHVRVVAKRKFATPVVSNELSFPTDTAAPIVETAGAPHRTTTTAQLNGRLVPRNSATTYRFQYGSQGPCSANPCASTAAFAAGSDDLTKLVATEIDGLTADTTYHYRLLADNGTGGEISGGDMSVRTRATDQLPNQNDTSTYPGPPASDRAWEMVSLAETSGNPVSQYARNAFADQGNRAIYGIAGGTPFGPTGTITSIYLSNRTSSGWQPSLGFLPGREQLVESSWSGLLASDDLAHGVVVNSKEGGAGIGTQIWGLHADAPAELFYERVPEVNAALALSADGSRPVARLGGAPDPAQPSATASNLYDLSSGSPKLASLLPGEMVGPCAVSVLPPQASDQVSADGAFVYFETPPTAPCGGAAQLFVRNFAAAETDLLSGPPLSGADCGAALIRAVPGAAFFATETRLDSDDIEPPLNCSSGNDVYRYDTATEAVECVTCVFPGFGVEVQGTDAGQIAVSDDGSRLYFTTTKRLLAGAPPQGQRGVYRLEVATGDLAYIAPLSSGSIGNASSTTEIDADGSVMAFSSSLGFLNPDGGTADNAGTTQYYRYDDEDRSLVCVSCPRDGSPPHSAVVADLHRGAGTAGHNQRALSADGQTLAFATSTPLVGADQNTAADPNASTDVYEWRDGRHLLITDGLTEWASAPIVQGISPSGRDIFFNAPAAYTPDAPDALFRLYDARIGGGFEFPPEGLPQCDLNSGGCEGSASTAPDSPGAGSAAFEGPGNPDSPGGGVGGQNRCAKLAVAFRRGVATTNRLRARAMRLRRAAKRSSNPGRTRALHRKARSVAIAAKRGTVVVKRQRVRAKNCRANASRRASR